MLRAFRHELRLFGVALQFLTRLTLPTAASTPSWDDRWLQDAVRYFPAVGVVVGSVTGVLASAAASVWSPAVAAVLAIGVGVWLTGAFHEDGLADTFDALGGYAGRERALQIMKDSRIGTFGAVALLVVTASRIGALAQITARSPSAAAWACVWAHALARWTSVAVMTRMPYAGDATQARARPLTSGVSARQCVMSALSLVPMAAAATLWMHAECTRVILALAAAMLVAWSIRRWVRRRLGGYTGDTLGATEQLAEAAVLLTLAAAWAPVA
ncbi:MAG TPA: adenosylcobinamide-GDP ribazoletransferase [Burkholderiaceae bacterium]|nr:adenosylcobinamide-GDP ribazoletransferase [Burkholderiaceae bacterium]